MFPLNNLKLKGGKMGRLAKISFYKLENRILKMYFLEKKTLEEISIDLKSNKYYISTEAVRRFIFNIENLLKRYAEAENVKRYGLLEHKYKLDIDLLKKIY